MIYSEQGIHEPEIKTAWGAIRRSRADAKSSARATREANTMKKKRLSERQRFILEFIREFVRDHGYAPSIREIKSAVELAGLVRTESGNTSTSVVDYNLK